MATITPGLSIELGIDASNFREVMGQSQAQAVQFAQATTRGVTTAASGFRGLSNVVSRAGDDFAVFIGQVQRGVNPIQAFTVQLSQVARTMGPAGGAVAIAASAIGALTLSLTGSAAAGEALQSITKRLDKDFIDHQTTVADLAARYRELTASQRILAGTEAVRQIGQLTEALAAQRDIQKSLVNELNVAIRLRTQDAAFEDPAVAQAVAIGAVVTALERQRITAGAAAAEIQRLALEFGDPRIREMAERLNASAQETDSLAGQLKTAEQAQALFADQTGEVVRQLESQITSTKELARLVATVNFDTEADRRVRVVSRSWWKLGGAGSREAWWGGSGGEVKVGR